MGNVTHDVPETTTVAALSDQRLLQRIKELSAVEQHLKVVVIDHLRELERRRLYLSLGFSSLFEYAVRELGYSDAAAWRRIKAMRLCVEVKGARGRIQDGTLTLNAAAELQHAFERQKRKQAGGGRGPQAGARPAAASNGSTADGAAPIAEPDAAPLLGAAERESLVARAAGKSTRQVKEMLADVDPELAGPADRMRPLGAGRWELKAVIDDDCRSGLEQLKGLLSHVDPQMTVGQLLGRVVQEAVERHDPSRPPRGRRRSRRTGNVAGAAEETSAPKDAPDAVAVQPVAQPAGIPTPTAKEQADSEHSRVSATARPATDSPTATSAPKSAGPDSAAGARAVGRDQDGGEQGAGWLGRMGGGVAVGAQPRVRGRGIPAAVRRQVWERDRGCCSYVDRGSGRRCGSRHLLEIDHVFPYALGGGADLDNLRLLCAAHHRHRHARGRPGTW